MYSPVLTTLGGFKRQGNIFFRRIREFFDYIMYMYDEACFGAHVIRCVVLDVQTGISVMMWCVCSCSCLLLSYCFLFISKIVHIHKRISSRLIESETPQSPY